MNKLFKVPDVKPQLVDMKKDLQIMKINVNDSTKQQYVIDLVQRTGIQGNEKCIIVE